MAMPERLPAALLSSPEVPGPATSGSRVVAAPVVLIDGPGTGKTQIATAADIQAFERYRRKVCFFSPIGLVNTVEWEKAKRKAGQIAESLTTLDHVILGELGYVASGILVASSDCHRPAIHADQHMMVGGWSFAEMVWRSRMRAG